MNIHDLSEIENATIRDFVQSCDQFLTGRVLDFGCGQQPYRSIIEGAGGTYCPYDRTGFGGNVSRQNVGKLEGIYDAVLCTQVLAYVHEVGECLYEMRERMVSGGALVLTYPAAWPVIRDELWHFTKLGMGALLTQAGFVVERHELRHGLDFDGFSVPMGYGAVARA